VETIPRGWSFLAVKMERNRRLRSSNGAAAV
jgi:hypothetical protein